MSKKDFIALGIVVVIFLIAWGVETLRDSRPELLARIRLGIAGVGVIALLLILTMHFSRAWGRDLGQWDQSDTITQWYQTMMQPDAPAVSCCGEADAYWCDDYYSRAGKAYCKITDESAGRRAQSPAC